MVRPLVTREKLEIFLRRLGAEATSPGTLYLTGGATALLLGIREQTIDIDIKLEPEPAGVFDAIARLKDELGVNVELAAPDHFIPALPGWQERSKLVSKEGKIEIRNYDLYSQALSKIERGHDQDLRDVRALVERKLIDTERFLPFFDKISPQIIRYPAINAKHFKQKIEEFVKSLEFSDDDED